MIVIKRRYRKSGSGFGNLFSKIIKTATSPAVVQKVKETAVNTALGASEQAIKKSSKRILDGQSNKKTKKQKIDQILGSGVILD